MSYHRQRHKRITGKHPDECDACEGLGQTRHSETVMVEMEETLVVFVDNKSLTSKRTRLVTARDPTTQRPKCGSGCLKCGGTGRLTRPPISGADVHELQPRLFAPRSSVIDKNLNGHWTKAIVQ